MQKEADAVSRKDTALASDICIQTHQKEFCEFGLRAFVSDNQCNPVIDKNNITRATTAVNDRRLISYMKSGCDSSSEYLCELYAYFVLEYPKMAPAKEATGAVEILRGACERGSGFACTRLGKAKVNGTGTKQSFPEAASLFKRGCELENAIGCANLAALYMHGTGVAKDLRTAASYRQKACDLGDQPSCSR